MRVQVGVACTALLAVSLVPAHADKKADEAAIRATMDKLIQAMKKKDMKGIMALSTSDFQMKNGPRTLNAKEAEQEMQQEFAMTKSMDVMEMKITKMDIKGNEAKVDTSDRFAMTIADTQGMMGPKGKTHKMAGTSKAHVTMVKQAGSWKFKFVDESDMKMTMDGKPFNPSAPPPAPKPGKK